MSYDEKDIAKHLTKEQLETMYGALDQDGKKELSEILGYTPRPDRDPRFYFIPKESDKRKPHRKHGSNYTPPKRRHRK